MSNESTLHEIRSRVDLVEYISEHVSLKKVGRNWKGLCPFHSEKTPSFIVSEEKQIFHCFGCHAGGDVFTFLMKMEGLSFPEALEQLAQKMGVQLPSKSYPGHSLNTDEKEALFQANRIAAWHYHEVLKKSPLAEKACQYLEKRGVKPQEIEKFRLGFCPTHSTEALLESLQKYKTPADAAFKTGIVRKGEFGHYETFRDRLIFPIFNRENKVVGLGGRILENLGENAKYINSSDSPIYNKSVTLFGLNLAKEAIRQKNRVFVVEGYLDVITMHQFGFEETVAPLGTALTLQQITALKRYADEIIMLFDADEAGWKAATRALNLFLDQSLSPKVLLLPEGEDPDTYLRKYGSENFKEKLKEVRNLLAVVIDKTLAKNKRDIEGKSLSLKELKPYLLKLTSPLERNLYFRKLAQDLDIPENWIYQELGLSPMTVKWKEKETKNPFSTAEEIFLEIFLQFESLRTKLVAEIHPEDFLNPASAQLARTLWKQVGEPPLGEAPVEQAPFSISTLLEKMEDPALKALITQYSLKEHTVETSIALSMALDCAEKIRTNRLKQKMGALSEQIKQAETKQENAQVLLLLKEKQNLLASFK